MRVDCRIKRAWLLDYSKITETVCQMSGWNVEHNLNSASPRRHFRRDEGENSGTRWIRWPCRSFKKQIIRGMISHHVLFYNSVIALLLTSETKERRVKKKAEKCATIWGLSCRITRRRQDSGSRVPDLPFCRRPAASSEVVSGRLMCPLCRGEIHNRWSRPVGSDRFRMGLRGLSAVQNLPNRYESTHIFTSNAQGTLDHTKICRLVTCPFGRRYNGRPYRRRYSVLFRSYVTLES